MVSYAKLLHSYCDAIGGGNIKGYEDEFLDVKTPQLQGRSIVGSF
jgi:hypothetical protein